MSGYRDAAAFAERLGSMGADPQRNRSGPWWTARCIHPEHQDDTPSMTFKDGETALVVHCFGCAPNGRKADWLRAVMAAAEHGQPLPPAAPSKRRTGGGGGARGTRVAVYDYRDAQGRTIARKVRYDPKTFGWERPYGEHWSEGLAGMPLEDLPLYGLGSLNGAEPGAMVAWCEGEKDTDRLAAEAGIPAVCSASSGTWPRDLSPLTGMHVQVVADNDAAGIKHALGTGDRLEGIAASITYWCGAVRTGGADVSDHFEAGHGFGDLIELRRTDGRLTPTTEPDPTDLADPADEDPPDEDRFWDRRALFRWCWDTGAAQMIPPGAILGDVLARASAAAGHRVTLPGIIGAPTTIGLGVIVAAGTGGGKTSAAAIVADRTNLAVHEAGLGTAEGIMDQYGEVTKEGVMQYRRRAVLFTSDEAEAALGLAARPGSILLPVIRSMVSGAPVALTYRHRPVKLERGQYVAAFLLAGQPQKFAPILTADEIGGGTPQRFLWLPGGFPDCPPPGGGPPAPGKAPVNLPPALGGVPPTEGGLPMPGTTIGVPEHIADEVRAARHKALTDPGTDPLQAHSMLTRLKTAAVLALIDGRTAISGDDWQDAAALDAISRATILAARAAIAEHDRQANTALAEREGQRAAVVDGARETAARGRVARRVAEHVHQHQPDGGCTRRCLAPALAARDRGWTDTATDLAVANGWILAQVRQDRSGRGGEVRVLTPGKRP